MSDIIEKLRREREERQKKQAEEMAKFEADLKSKREQRLRDKMLLSENKISAAPISQQVSKTAKIDTTTSILKQINSSLSQVEASQNMASQSIMNLNKDLQRKQQHREDEQQKWSDLKRQDRLKHLERTMKLDSLAASFKFGRTKPKRFEVNPKEFYDLDFSYDANGRDQSESANNALKNISEREQELLAMVQSREDELLQDPDALHSLISKGELIVKGMKDTATFGLLGKDQQESLIKAQIQNNRVDNYSVSDYEQDDRLLASPLAGDDDQPQLRENRFKERMKSSIQKVDYSEYFPSNIGLVEGVFVFRIEDMQPAQLPLSKDSVQLSVGDCYIVLKVFENQNSQLDWRIFQFVGKQSSMDKQACSAIYAVGLRDLLPQSSSLGVRSDIQREQSGEESEDFLNVFRALGLDYHLSDASQAASGGLYRVLEREYPLLCYQGRVSSQRHRRLVFRLVESNFLAFSSKYSYIVDAGKSVYVWYGAESLQNDRAKVHLQAQLIVSNERSSIMTSAVQEVHQGSEFENEDFMELFSDCQLQSISEEEESETDDVSQGIIDIILREISAETLRDVKKTKSLDIAILQIRSLDFTSLSEECCYLLDCVSQIFFWVGHQCSDQVRTIAEQLALPLLVESQTRPGYMQIVKLYQKTETEIFKSYFNNWPQIQAGSQQSRDNQANGEQKSAFQTRIDIRAIYDQSPGGRLTRKEEEFYQELFTRANSLLLSFKVFRYSEDRRNFIAAQDWNVDLPISSSSPTADGSDFGHFCSDQMYIFLCVYRKIQKQEDAEGGDVSGDPDNVPLDMQECVTYVWTGRHLQAPSIAYLKFQHHFKDQIKALILQLSGGKSDVRFVYMNQEKESLALCAHLRKSIIVHWGSSSASGNVSDEGLARLYHIRTDIKYKVTRCIQTTPMVKSLCTRDVFLLIGRQQKPYLWIGNGASKEEEKLAKLVAMKCLRLDQEADINKHVQIFKEKLEPDEFWHQLGPDFEKVKLAPGVKSIVSLGQGYYYSLPPPRLFKCSTASGSFVVTELTAGNNAILYADILGSGWNGDQSVFWLDSCPGRGKPYLVYVWIGAQVSDVVVKLAKKALDSYLQHLADGRSLNFSEWDEDARRLETSKRSATVVRHDVVIVRQGSEPDEFRAFFHGWGSDFSISTQGMTNLQINSQQRQKLIDQYIIGRQMQVPQSAFQRGELKEGQLV
ncbi:hypothetical protein MP228_007822 [Amoeboaphelidium protococcarum]|nr:hypothetical protein MP228_007822 [Amoeboaphelidium protococcarum]